MLSLRNPLRRTGVLAAGLLFAVAGAQAGEEPAPTREELYQIIQKQQQQIEALNERLDRAEGQVADTTEQVSRTQKAVEATASAVEQGGGGQSARDRTHIGGYGELHANRLDNQSGGADKNDIDFHRFVLFLSHEFNDDIRFNSELEVEHAYSGEGKPGAVELEQAYVEFDLTDRLWARGGLFLVPVGIINPTHEPPTFFGVERNPVENKIIPTTWWEGGASLGGELGNGFSFEVAMHSGLETSLADGYTPRAGRQKVAKASFENLATTGQLKYTGIPGLELAASVQYQDDITQGFDPTAGGATLFETHADWREGPFGLRALYARWDLDGSGPESIGADEQAGFYIEPSWRFTPQWGIFARYNQWDNAAGNAADTEFTQVDLGVNWWPHESVVVKADYQDQDAPAGKSEFDGFNLGIGYMF